MITEDSKHRAARILFAALGKEMAGITSTPTAKQINDLRSDLELIAELSGNDD